MDRELGMARRAVYFLMKIKQLGPGRRWLLRVARKRHVRSTEISSSSRPCAGREARVALVGAEMGRGRGGEVGTLAQESIHQC